MYQRPQPLMSNAGEKLQVGATAIPDVKLLAPKRFDDERGFFAETYNMRLMSDINLPSLFVQDNHSMSRRRGTVRGLHFQMPPRAQHKLLWVIRGAVLDVAVDLRKGSPWFGEHVSTVLSAKDGRQIFVPAGFAHGFCTMVPNTEVVYKVSDSYAPEYEAGIFWNDSDLGIDWPTTEDRAVVSPRDMALPRLRDVVDILPFSFAS